MILQGKGCAWELLSADPSSQARVCILGGCSLIAAVTLEGYGALLSDPSRQAEGEITALLQRNWGNTANPRMPKNATLIHLYTWHRLTLHFERPLRSFQCHYCYWEFNMGLKLSFLNWNVSLLADNRLKNLRKINTKLSNYSCHDSHKNLSWKTG